MDPGRQAELLVLETSPVEFNSSGASDIEPNSITERKSEQQPLWSSGDNAFRFNFLQDNFTDILNQASSSSEQILSQLRFTGQEDCTFAFNFQIVPKEEDMDGESSDAPSSHKQKCTELENTSVQQSSSPSNTSTSNTSKKKKKKTGINKAVNDNTKKEPKAAEKQECETAELSTEEQLQRQLDWCIEQLELGMRSHKANPKQKEEASRALKTLRSSKAPLVKKRQVMRAMAGDYRKKMEEEKSKQFKLIQNETASTQLRAVSDLPKKSSFHRRAGIKASTSESNFNSNNSDATAASDENFVFTASNEEFRFNFL